MRTLLVSLLILLSLSLVFTPPLSAQDLNTVIYKGHVNYISWVENVEFNGSHTYSSVTAYVWSYSPFPQLLPFFCLQDARWVCLSPAFLGCPGGVEAPLTIQQLQPPSAYPIRVTRRCQDSSTDPGAGNCVRLQGYYNWGAQSAETTQPANVTVLSYGECTPK